MSNKERYRQLCEAEGAFIPLFQQYWWMDTVCYGKQWDVLLAERDGGRVVAALPYLYGKKLGLRYVLPAQMTQYNGPWLAPTLSDDERQKATAELVEQLENLHLAIYQQTFAPDITDWLPFHWRGYSQTTRYTYRIDPLLPLDEQMALASPERRKRLDLLRRECTVDHNVSPGEFAAFHHEYYMRRDGHNLLPKELVQRVCTTSLQRGQALLYGLRDSGGRLLVADLVVYDSRCAYSLVSGMAKEAPRNANSLLFWTLIGDLYGHTAAFDFEGSMDPGIGYFFRSFGATLTPLMRVSKCRLPLLESLLKL